MVGGHTDVRRPLPEQLQDRADDAPDGRDLLAGRGAVWGGAEEVAEQLVGAVDEVDLHGGPESVTAGGPAAATRARTHRHSTPAGTRPWAAPVDA